MSDNTDISLQIPNGIPVARARRARRAAAFTKRDVTRAVKAVQDAGLQVGMVRVEPGAIIVIPGAPPAVPSSAGEPNDWD